jgi:hypothetical protein
VDALLVSYPTRGSAGLVDPEFSKAELHGLQKIPNLVKHKLDGSTNSRTKVEIADNDLAYRSTFRGHYQPSQPGAPILRTVDKQMSRSEVLESSLLVSLEHVKVALEGLQGNPVT